LNIPISPPPGLCKISLEKIRKTKVDGGTQAMPHNELLPDPQNGKKLAKEKKLIAKKKLKRIEP